MPTPAFSWKAALCAFLLGVGFAVANIYLSGGRHQTLANLCFGLALVCEMAFTVFAVLWVMGKSWLAQNAPQQQPGAPRPMQPGASGLPPGVTINPAPRPPQGEPPPR